MPKKPRALEEHQTAYDGRLYSPSVSRNVGPISQILSPLLQPGAHVLEIASGTGEHAAHILQQNPQVIWQSSDLSSGARQSIEAWRKDLEIEGFLPSIELNASDEHWPIEQDVCLDFIVCINMVHISPWEAGIGVIRGAGK